MTHAERVATLDDALVPPARMLFDGSSSPEQFITLGDGFCREILVNRIRLRATDSILDLGCGNGQISRALTRIIAPAGRYDGLDVHQESIAWLQTRYRAYPHFHFHHIDVHNVMYNPGGRQSSEDFQLPFPPDSFDVVLLKSVFTHMRPLEVSNYLREVSRLLKSTGRCLVTFFLLNEEQTRLASQGANDVEFKYGEGVWRYRLEQSPESAVAYDENYVMQMLEENGLTLRKPIYYGSWSGRNDGLSYQDILLLEKMRISEPSHG